MGLRSQGVHRGGRCRRHRGGGRAGRPGRHLRAARRAAARSSSSTRSPSRTSAGRRSGPSAGCSLSIRRSSAGSASRIPSSWPGRTGRAAPALTASTPRTDLWPRRWAEAYVHFAAGEKRAWLRKRGVRFFPIVGWAERGGYTATGHGNSVPRFHITWGTGPGLVEPFAAGCARQSCRAGRPRRSGTAWTSWSSPTAWSAACAAPCSNRRRCRAGRAVPATSLATSSCSPRR